MRSIPKEKLYGGLVLLWLVFIFAHSLQPANVSTQESAWVLRLLQRLLPFLTMHLVRKTAHFAEFAVLGLLGGLFFRQIYKTGWRPLVVPAKLGMLAALCDETIQLFSAGRVGCLQDVWLDTAGAYTGVVFLWAVHALHEKKRRPGPAAAGR